MNFLIDSSALKDIFEGNKENKSLELLEGLEKINSHKNMKEQMKLIALNSSFLRAIYLMNKDVSVENVKRVLEIIQFVPNTLDFKDGKQEIDSVIKFSKLINNSQNNEK